MKKKSTKLPESLDSENNVDVDPEHDNSYDILFNSQNSINNRNKADKYTMKYRFIKTILLIIAWISFGLNFEMIGPTLEDLKIYLDVNYSSISLGLVLRNTGYLALTLFFGLILDKVSNYSEALMGVSSALIGLTNLLMPVTRNYILQMMYFFTQGIAQAVYDLGGNYIILNLWTGVNTSPINAMHAGYGIGAIMAIQLAKPFISFDPFHIDAIELHEDVVLNTTKPIDPRVLLTFNETYPINRTKLTHQDINLKVPYWIASFIAVVLAVLFFISQILENRNRKEYEKNRKQLILLQDEFNFDSSSIGSARSLKKSKLNRFVQKLFFGEKFYEGKLLFYVITQTILFIIIFVFNQGYFTVISRFMLTYLTMGPARLSLEMFVVLQTLFWAFFIFGRFFAAYLAFKLDSLYFYFSILIANSVFCLLFLFPFLTNLKMFFWVGVSLLGLTSGPMTPTGFMLAKQILDFNSFVLSLFIVGLAFGGIIFQQITGALLDYFNPVDKWMGFSNPNSSFIIPHLAFLASFLCLLFFLPLFILYRKFDRQLKK